MKLTTTLVLLQQHHACKSGYGKLLRHIGADYPKDQEINLLTILESNDVQDMLWCLRATQENSQVISVKLAREFADSVKHLRNNDYDAAACAYDAACAAAADAYDAAAHDAAYDAYGDAYDAAAHDADACADAAYAAAAAAEHKKQAVIIRKYLSL